MERAVPEGEREAGKIVNCWEMGDEDDIGRAEALPPGPAGPRKPGQGYESGISDNRVLEYLFTPMNRAHSIAPRRDFSGFGDEQETRREYVLKRRVSDLEREMQVMMQRMTRLEKHMEVLTSERDVWRGAYNDLHKQMLISEKKAEDTVKMVNKIEEGNKVWKQVLETENTSFKQIVQEQVMGKDQAITEKVIKVIKEKPEIVRDTVEKKKSLVIIGLKEEVMPVKSTRERNERVAVEKVIEEIQEEQDLVGEVEEVFRLGKYKEGTHRPMKIRLRSQVAAETIAGKSWKLSRKEAFKDVWVRKDRSVEERNTIRELKKQANERNEARSDEEKKKFFWRVMDMDLRKWYRKEEETS